MKEALRKLGAEATTRCNFRDSWVRCSQDWAHNITDIRPQENSMRRQSQSCLNSKYLWFVPSRRASLDVGMDVSVVFSAGVDAIERNGYESALRRRGIGTERGGVVLLL